jgi:methionine synthase I (cobalamin-dependent)/5,10-methylenetetrahydrofolate reductase
MQETLLARLQSRVLVCDGATGTMLYAAGLPLDRLPPEANLSNPELVRSVHSAYLAAGVDIIQTNTFGASRHRLARYGVEDRMVEINQSGVRIAREARDLAGVQTAIAGSVGPATPPGFRGRLDLVEAKNALNEQIETLVDAGVDLLILETFGDLHEMVEAVQLAQAACALPIVAQMTFVDDNRTLAGDSPDDVAGRLEELGVALIGANCTLGPQGLLEVLRELARHTSLPLAAQPNAGLPSVADGRLHYTAEREYFARYARRFVEAGAALVGGCCGTTPEHSQAVAQAVADLAPPRRRLPRADLHSGAIRAGGNPDANRLAEKIRTGQFTVVCEMQPSYGGDVERALRDAGRCRDTGADAILVAPSTSPRAQMSPATLALLLEQRLQVETILTATTWDKSAMALQADLLGAYAFGIRNVICRTGTPPPRGDYPHAGIWDVDSVGLIEILRSLNEGRDANGIPVGKPTDFFIGARVNPTSEEPEQELADARRKIAAGAGFLATQPVYDLSAFFGLLDALGPLDLPVLMAVTPLRDFRHAEYLQHEVPGVSLPEAVVKRMWDAGERGPETGLAIARELIEATRERVSGVLLTSASGSVVEMVQLLETLPR